MGVTINNYSFNKSKWQRRGENGNWLDVPGTVTSGVCALTTDQPGEYRWVAEGRRNGIAGTYVSNNTVIVGGDNVQETNPKVLVVDPDSPPIYWTDYGTDKIQRANLDGSNVQDLVTSGLRSPVGIALDAAGGKMYWTDWGTAKIQRANLDGSNVEDLVTSGLDAPASIALDIAGGKMYWTDWGTDKIQRANLDGSNVEDLVTSSLRRAGFCSSTIMLLWKVNFIAQYGGCWKRYCPTIRLSKYLMTTKSIAVFMRWASRPLVL